MAFNLRILATAAFAVVLVTTVVGPAGASTTTSAKNLQRDLLPSSYADKAGFTEVVEKATSTSKTGEKSCPDGAQELFEDPSGPIGMQVQLLACTSTKAAAALVGEVAASGSMVSSPPKGLGSTAVERSGGNSTYGIYWRRGKVVELISIETNIPATTTTTTTTTIPSLPLTPAQQQLLSNTALEQNKLH